MIHRPQSSFTIEGNVVSHLAPASGTVRQRVEINTVTGLIDSVEPAGGGGGADLALGAEFLIFPGFIDLHVHAREDVTATHAYKETFESAGRAAIHGGVTAIVDMPNNPRPPVDDASYAAKRQVASTCPVDVLLYAGIGPKTRPLSFAVPYKAYMGPSIGDLFFQSEDSLREALARYRGHRVSFHAEDPEILIESKGAPTHGERRPAIAEIRAVETAITLSESFGIVPNICHLSTAGGLDHIRAARKRGLEVTCEVTPHHLFYDQDNAAGFSSPGYLQCNPPLRSRLDRIALLQAFRQGEIDYLATDHAPHSLEENECGISGVPHLDTFGSFIFWLLAEGVKLHTIRAAASERPGKFLSRFLPQRFGRVEPGFVGSLSILRQTPATVRRAELKTRAGWSPFEGCRFGGQVSHTIVRGQVFPHPDAAE